jgi:parvulin-like peptidyl-prolyl isomerase
MRAKRLPLILFGALVILLFVGFAIAEGLTHPSVPSDDVAVVQDAPAGLGHISKAQFDRALRQTAARSGVKKVPKPGSDQYEQLKTGAMNDLLDQVWIQGEGEELGVPVTANEVDSLLKQTIKQNFKNQAEFEKFRKQSHFTTADIRTRIRLQILSNKIQQQVLASLAPVSSSQVSEFYDAAKDQFTQPETRDIRVVLNKDQAKVETAKAALDKNSSDANWQTIAQQYSTDPSSKANGGLRPSITEGLLEEPLNGAVFSASKGQVEGPIKTPLGYYVFEVEKVTPQKTTPLNKSTSQQIRSQLTQQAQQNAFSAFVDDFGSKWRACTFCAAAYVIDRCNNFKGNAHPSTAPAGCYTKTVPKKGRPDACPAPVSQLQPALPGTVRIVNPQGTRLPQRPIPLATPTAAGGLGGATLPTGAAPTGAAPTGAAPTTGTSP